MLDQIDDGFAGTHPFRDGHCPPIGSGEEKNVGLGRVPRTDGLGNSKPGVGRVPLRLRREGDSGLVSGGRSDVIEIVPDLEMPAGKSAQIAMEKHQALSRIAFNRRADRNKRVHRLNIMCTVLESNQQPSD